jgi:DNA-binding transcriptional ArsR family regulator
VSKLGEKIKKVVVMAGVSGIASSAVASALSCGIETVSGHLRKLEKAGFVERSRYTGHQVRWGPPGTWAHHEAARGKAAINAQAKRRRAELAATESAAAVDYVDLPMVRRLVCANSCRPMVKTGPASVFELARWAA